MYDAQEKFGEEDHRAPITEEVKEFGEIGTHSLQDSKISETSCFQSQMHFDDSVESTADSDLEDGELQKTLTSPYSNLLSPKSFCRHMFHRNLLGLFDHLFFALPTALVTESGTTCANPLCGSLFGRMAEQSPITVEASRPF